MKTRQAGAGPTGASPQAFQKVAAAILALFPPLTGEEQRVSLALYRLLGEGHAVAVDRLARSTGVAAAEIERTLARWPNVHRRPDGAVTGYGGLTIQPTPHRIRLGRIAVYGWCAWDTLFLPELLAQRVRVESKCPMSGEAIGLDVSPEGVAAGGRQLKVSFVAPDPQKAAQDIVKSFCRFVHFFASEEAGAHWLAQHPGAVLATLEEAWALGRRRNKQRY